MASSETTSRPDRGTGAVSARGFRLNWWQAALGGAVAASVANVAIWLLARAAGAPMTLHEPGEPVYEVGLLDGVVLMSAAPILIGVALTAALALLWRGFIRVGQVVGALLALTTIFGIFLADGSTGTYTALTLMHIVSAVVVVAALEGLHRRTADRG